jgi:hypothetical protein
MEVNEYSKTNAKRKHNKLETSSTINNPKIGKRINTKRKVNLDGLEIHIDIYTRDVFDPRTYLKDIQRRKLLSNLVITAEELDIMKEELRKKMIVIYRVK